MRRKITLILWGLLIAYSLVHLLFFNQGFASLSRLMTFNENPLLLAVFNLMGLFPLAFVLFIVTLQPKLSKLQITGLALSFFTGAFALAPVLASFKRTKQTRTIPYFTVIVTAGLAISMGLILYAVTLGSLDAYIEIFKTDSFVHIMTIDFLVLTALSGLYTYPYSKRFFYTIIPVFGFFITLYDIKKSHPEDDLMV